MQLPDLHHTSRRER